MSRPIDLPEHLLKPQRIQLRDGRQLAWYEFGDPAGTPCVYTSGTPTSGTAGIFYHSAMRAAGIRWISLDKPGYGASDDQPGRRLLDWADDVSALADHLRLSRFAVAGESGGGPHALALCHALPQRVTVGIVLSGLGPFQDAAIRVGMHKTNRLMFWLAAHASPLLWIPALTMRKAMRRTLDDPDAGWQKLQKQLAGMPASDRAVYEDPKLRRMLVFAGYNALRHGPRAGVAEMKMLTQPWGFSLADIQVPVHLWHGTADVNVPVAMGRHVAAALPNCRSTIVAGAGQSDVPAAPRADHRGHQSREPLGSGVMRLDEYARYDAIGLMQLLRGRQVTARELHDCALLAAERLDPQLNFMAGELHRESNFIANAAMSGLPFLLKEGTGLKGGAIAMGSRLSSGLQLPADSEITHRLRQAGLQFLGETTAPEFGIYPVTESSLHGVTRNPWNLDHSPGGSSGGSSAAVAAGVVPVAQTSDGGGSIRGPAHCVGIFGLKPSAGRTPTPKRGLFDFSSIHCVLTQRA